MKKKVKRSKLLRAFNSLCAVLLMVSAIYILVMGFNSVAMAAMAISVVGAAAPLAQSDEGILEIVSKRSINPVLADGFVFRKQRQKLASSSTAAALR
ncbi:hypothetical protein ACQKFE_22855, partial [Stutzerimonas stutzeri]|uniref:hypothetical protein n=1 Tax=Stutzerimonas stutzeri TaxID=316 RepID=UPI003D0919E5